MRAARHSPNPPEDPVRAFYSLKLLDLAHLFERIQPRPDDWIDPSASYPKTMVRKNQATIPERPRDQRAPLRFPLLSWFPTSKEASTATEARTIQAIWP